MDYEATLAALLEYVGERVQVLVGAAGDSPHLFVQLKGVLKRAEATDIWAAASGAPDEEAMIFTVGDGEFVIYRSRFDYGHDESGPNDVGPDRARGA